MAKQCPKCMYHADHIYTIEISPKTQQRWRIERCPNCQHAFDIELEREYQRRKREAPKKDERRDIGPSNPPGGWMFGL